MAVLVLIISLIILALVVTFGYGYLKFQVTRITSKNQPDTTLEQVMVVLNQNQLDIPGLLLLYGNLGYHIGASMAGIKDKGPNLEELKRSYYSHPTVDVGLMIQGLLITSWVDDFLKDPKLSSFAEINQKKKE